MIIKFKDGHEEEFHSFNVSPTGIQMRNTGSDQLRKVLKGDGRDLIVFGNEEKGIPDRVIRAEEIQDIIVNGVTVLMYQTHIKDHQCGVWCDRC